jgi:hypothetical protein
MLVGTGKLESKKAENPLGAYMLFDASQPKNPAYMPNTSTRNTAENASGNRELRKLNKILVTTPFEFWSISFSLSHD